MGWRRWVSICAVCFVAGTLALWLLWLPWLEAIGVTVAITILLVALWAIWWWLPKYEANNRLSGADAKAKAEVEDKFRKTVSNVLGGAAVIIGAFLTYYGTMRTLQENHDQSQRTIQTSRDQFLSAQVSKGLEALGSSGDDKIMVRLGGIYGLEGVMKVSEAYESEKKDSSKTSPMSPKKKD
jgi:hypothetical protein